MWFNILDKQVKITIFAKPNAKKTAVLGIGEQGLLISLHAKPHQGEANKELVRYLSKFFDVPKTQIILLKGEGGRIKQVLLPLTDSVNKIIKSIK
jgi:uncharacterized protein (TIGR00251 family)